MDPVDDDECGILPTTHQIIIDSLEQIKKEIIALLRPSTPSSIIIHHTDRL